MARLSDVQVVKRLKIHGALLHELRRAGWITDSNLHSGPNGEKLYGTDEAEVACIERYLADLALLRDPPYGW